MHCWQNVKSSTLINQVLTGHQDLMVTDLAACSKLFQKVLNSYKIVWSKLAADLFYLGYSNLQTPFGAVSDETISFELTKRLHQ